MQIGHRSGALVGRVLALEPRHGVGVGQGIAARLIREEELAAQFVGGRQLMIDVGRELILLEGRRDHRDHLATLEQLRAVSPAVRSGGTRRNQVGAIRKRRLQELPRNRVDGAEGDRPVRRRPDRGRKGVDAGVRSIVGERSRQQDRVAGLIDKRGLRLRSLIRPEEERLVPGNRAAEGAAALVAPEDRLLDVRAIEEEVVGHHRVVLMVVVADAAIAIGAALRHQREVAAAVSAGAGVVEARLQLHLLQRFRRRRDVSGERSAAILDGATRAVDAAVAAQQVGDVDAVEDEAVIGGARAVHARRHRRVVVREQFADVGGHTWLDDQQLSEVTRRGRQRLELLLIERARHGHRTGRHHLGIGDHVDRLGHRADLERHVDGRHFGRRDREAVAPQQLESRQLEARAIDARREKARLPVARGVAGDGPSASGLQIA